MRFAILSVVLLSTASAWEIDYYRGQGCRGEFRGSQTINSGAGKCVKAEVTGDGSALVKANGKTSTNLQFYTGSNCDGDSIGFTAVASCVTFAENGFGSIKVTN